MKKVFRRVLVLAVMVATVLTSVVPAQAASTASFVNLRASNITASSARVDFNISNPSRKAITQAGLEIKASTASKWTVKTDYVANAYKYYTSLPCWYIIGSGKEVNLALKAGTTYQYRAFGVVGGVKYYSTIKTFTTPGKAATTAKTTTAAKVQSPSFNSVKASMINNSKLRIDFNISNPSKLSIVNAGFQVRKKGDSKWSTATDTVSSTWRTKTSIPCWYYVGSGQEVNIKIAAGTTYECRAFCKVGGTTYYSVTYRLTINVPVPVQNPSFDSIRESNLSSSFARIDFYTKNPGRLTVTNTGIRIKKKGASNWAATKTDSVPTAYRTQTSIPCWYSIGSGQEVNFNLQPNTTYEYQAFCIAGGKTYNGPIKSFTTPKKEARQILNNGLGGIYIDINAAPYSEKRHVVGGREISYTNVGCTWFVACRVEQLTGKKNIIVHAPHGESNASWLNNAWRYGFSTSEKNLRGRSIAVYDNHVSIIEKVEGDYVYISEGGFIYGDSTNGYCVIRKVHKSEVTKWSSVSGSFRGYVHF